MISRIITDDKNNIDRRKYMYKPIIEVNENLNNLKELEVKHFLLIYTNKITNLCVCVSVSVRWLAKPTACRSLKF